MSAPVPACRVAPDPGLGPCRSAAARTAGSGAAAELFDTLVSIDSFDLAIRSASRAGAQSTADWVAACERVRSEISPQLPALRQLSIRDNASRFASHPRAGLRVRMIYSRPAEAARIVLGKHDVELIDAELAPHFAAARRDVAWNY